ncbi:MAG: UDP-2,3-diacylglucosamine diphosphatase [Thioalkalispiraceae bacterium]|jgi:UDP-2,3-diacylglucosamine hydrolase
MSTLFISDLHLSQERPQINKLFLTFLEQTASKAEALYILGDLFEVWLGDDMILPDYQPALEQIANTVQTGTSIYIMYGNRDFLMRERFEHLTGAQIIHEPFILDLYGTRTLLLHGDTLCTDDIEYQKFRSMVRNEQWQAELLSKTPQQRLELARHYREISKTETAQKDNAIMDVNQETVEQTMREHGVLNLIHGHTHRPARHEFELDGKPATRFVLPDWFETGGYLAVSEQGYEVHEVK